MTDLTLTRADFEQARGRVAPHTYHTPILTSRSLSEASGFDVRLKAELFQKGGSYKVRGPTNLIGQLTDEERARGVICSTDGTHSQGVAIAARQYGVQAVVCMAENATPSKIAATEGYGAEVVLHGTIWDEANEKITSAQHPSFWEGYFNFWFSRWTTAEWGFLFPAIFFTALYTILLLPWSEKHRDPAIAMSPFCPWARI